MSLLTKKILLVFDMVVLFEKKIFHHQCSNFLSPGGLEDGKLLHKMEGNYFPMGSRISFQISWNLCFHNLNYILLISSYISSKPMILCLIISVWKKVSRPVIWE